MAVLKFRIYWEEDEGTYRDILIKHKQTFHELHAAILKGYAFDQKHAATFYKSNDQWQEGREITLEKYDRNYKVEPLLMNETVIGTQIADPNQKFIYLYDFEKQWRFLVELINIDKEDNPNMEYPHLTRSEGLGPVQYNTKTTIDSRLAEMEEKFKFDADALLEGFTEEGEEGSESEEAGGEEENNSEEDAL